jgi:outer membrane protein OmpA-like peptidoglycan-associated protein
MKNNLFFCLIYLLFSCNNDNIEFNTSFFKYNISNSNKLIDTQNSSINRNIIEDNLYVNPIKFSHTINTSASEYYPTISPDGQYLYFTGMDRTGFFDYKILFNKTRNNGGEDIFFSKLVDGYWTDSKDLKILNTNGHESVNQIFENGDLLITGNYPENIGPSKRNNGSNTTDIFIATNSFDYNLSHFDEPINSIYNEADAFMTSDKNTILFVSDRPGSVGNYQKKGWLWNDSYWGNTDIYVAFKNGDSWSNPLNLGKVINTEFSERTPFLTKDGLKLYLSSNGYNTNRKDLNIYYFVRKDFNDWSNWDGPYEISGLNSITDDWGYKEDLIGNLYFSRANKSDFIPTKKGKDGTGFLFESNFRSGYSIYGQQSGSFNFNEQTDIYFYNKNNVAVSLPDILFDFDSYKLKYNANFVKLLLDFININQPKAIKIVGYTDSNGTEKYNLDLSLNRAIEIKNLLIKNNIKYNIETIGKGMTNPIATNKTKEGRSLNRRVEIYFIY